MVKRRSVLASPTAPVSRPLELEAKLFRGLGDPVRLALLRALDGGPRTAGELTMKLGITPSNARNHLRCLLECGLVAVAFDGRFNRYRLASASMPRLLDAAAAVLTVAGPAIEECFGVRASVASSPARRPSRLRVSFRGQQRSQGRDDENLIVAACRLCYEACNRTTFWSEGMTPRRSSRGSRWPTDLVRDAYRHSWNEPDIARRSRRPQRDPPTTGRTPWSDCRRGGRRAMATSKPWSGTLRHHRVQAPVGSDEPPTDVAEAPRARNVTAERRCNTRPLKSSPCSLAVGHPTHLGCRQSESSPPW